MGLSLRPYFLCRGEGGGGGGLSTSPGPSNPPAANQASATSSSNQSSTSAPHSPYGPLPYDISFGNHSGMSNSECTVQMGAMGYFSEFNSGVADGFFDFFGDIRDAAFDPVGSLSGLWNDFRNAPFRFTLDNIVFSPFNPTTPLRNAFTGFRDDGVHGLGNAFGQHAAVVTSVAAVYVACKSVGYLNTVVIGAVTGTLGQGAQGLGSGSAKWKSVREFGHSFNRHGAGVRNTRALAGRAASTGQSQGQWTNNQEAANFLNSLGNITETKTVNIPPGLGQVITPTGEIIPATRAIIVPSPTGIRTAYPIL